MAFAHRDPTISDRPKMGFRSVSDISPLGEPVTDPNGGSHSRTLNVNSGACLASGKRIPFSPLLPLPPASPRESDNLASRRKARRGGSEAFLRVDTAVSRQTDLAMPHPKSAGMIRSYSLPVATQDEHEEQRRIMTSTTPSLNPNPAWWSYGWPSPGGAGLSHRPSLPRDRLLAPRFPTRSKFSPYSVPKSPHSPRSQYSLDISTPTPSDEDYFNAHSISESDQGSDEPITPRTSPDSSNIILEKDDYSFIHPDHLLPMTPLAL